MLRQLFYKPGYMLREFIDQELLTILYFIIPLALITWSYVQFYAIENSWQVGWRIILAYIVNYVISVFL